ncbi:MAG TPA: hypothetical protein VNY27_03395 [Solirubrobacteraceae bacterium]|nr:hypothetical protein [Solirubrobacteraceae bacterium]
MDSDTPQPMIPAGGATLGSYTPFSTWTLETHSLAEDHRRQPRPRTCS